eukprot:scaffold2587_cov40-Attheya_sp.AAC.1
MVILEPPQHTLKLLRDSLPDDPSLVGGEGVENESAEVIAYVAALAASLADAQDFDSTTWVEALAPYLATLPALSSTSEDAVENFR